MKNTEYKPSSQHLPPREIIDTISRGALIGLIYQMDNEIRELREENQKLQEKTEQI